MVDATHQTSARDTALGRSRITNALVAAAEALDRRVGWSRLPTPLGLAVLVGLRAGLRARNLFDTGPHPDGPLPPGRPDEHRTRTLDGTYNTPGDPRAGSIGCRFGRNIPLDHTRPEDSARILDPNPRTVSTALLARDEFRPATTLNLLAAAWIQFEVHDWFSHRPADAEPFTVTVADGDRPEPTMTIARTATVPAPDPTGPPTFVTGESHWWDASQIYGGTAEAAGRLRSGKLGQVIIDELGLPPLDAENLVARSPAAANAWVGLALLHSLFLREHNAICERLVARYPDRRDDQWLYDTARLINAALIAKIHTVDWTPAVIAHPTTVAALRANWFGLLGERIARRFGRLVDNEVLCGIPGSACEDHGVPYSLTEEFVAVYRMHPLIPDELTVRSLADDRELARFPFPALGVRHIRQRLAETPMDTLLYSFGRANPGALTLHNYPEHLRRLDRGEDQPLDLATIDILRIRERDVPRYNEFRRHLRLTPARSFDDLTDDPRWVRELAEVYDTVDDVDLLIGLYAEPKPPGFGFGDTAFRIFVLMASRRLSADRFFTTDFRPEIYTEAGMTWVRDNTMRTVLLRHFPTLAPALSGVANPFAPWRSR
ncbi:peroxidase family protein [Nocardia sp. GTS18]|uniref:peroxidase family protein n=1 Tax=Nocardia sp. GTS18 TaxID=1778064 RepID=UPI0015EFBD05|nr:peroxidase family protein [Nocardia sp. GTS18]